jgi:hypothetical protein
VYLYTSALKYISFCHGHTRDALHGGKMCQSQKNHSVFEDK